MDKISTTHAINNLAISPEVKRAQRAGFEAASSVDEQVSNNTERKRRWENTPGISVSLQSLEQQPELNEYQQLRMDGRRKEATMAAAPLEHAKHIHAKDDTSSASVNPRSRVVLESFIQQMGGAEQSAASGNYINTSV